MLVRPMPSRPMVREGIVRNSLGGQEAAATVAQELNPGDPLLHSGKLRRRRPNPNGQRTRGLGSLLLPPFPCRHQLPRTGNQSHRGANRHLPPGSQRTRGPATLPRPSPQHRPRLKRCEGAPPGIPAQSRAPPPAAPVGGAKTSAEDEPGAPKSTPALRWNGQRSANHSPQTQSRAADSPTQNRPRNKGPLL